MKGWILSIVGFVFMASLFGAFHAGRYFEESRQKSYEEHVQVLCEGKESRALQGCELVLF